MRGIGPPQAPIHPLLLPRSMLSAVAAPVQPPSTHILVTSRSATANSYSVTKDPALIIVLAGVCAALHVGKLPPAVPVLQNALGISLLQAGFLLSMVQVAGMTLGLAVGLSADHLGLRRCLLIGLALLSLASAAGGWATDADSLMLLRAVEGMGFLMVVMPAPAMLRRLVQPEHLHSRMGWWGAYMPLGTALALLLGPPLMAWLSWSAWWWLLSMVSALAGLAVWFRVPAVPTLPPRPGYASPAWPARLSLTLRTPGPWLVALCFAAYSGQWMAVIGFMPTVYAQTGLGPQLAGLLTACVALMNVSGNLGSGYLLQRGWPTRHILHMGFACMVIGALGTFGQIQGASLPMALRFACVLLFSAMGGLIPATLFSMAVRLAPSEPTVSTTVGFVQQWSAIGQFAAPPLVAWLAASVGGWQWTWLITTTLCALGAALALGIQRALDTQTSGNQA